MILWMIIFMIISISNICFATTGTVSVTAVRMREATSTDSKIVTIVYEDDKVEILEENGEWYKVKYGDSVGFAKKEFFKITESNAQSSTNQQQKTENSVTTPQESNATNVANTVPEQSVAQPSTETENLTVGEKITLQNAINLRLMPSFSSSANIAIPQGTEVTIDTKLGNWYKITNQTTTGWTTKSKMITPNVLPETPPAPEPEQPVVPKSEPEPEAPQNTTTPEPTNTVQPETLKPESTTNTTSENNATQRKAVVIVETARVRKSASKESEIIDTLDEDDVVSIIEEQNGFYKITTSSISEGYVSKSLLKEKDVTSRGASGERESAPTQQEQSAPQATAGNDIVAFAKQYLGYPYVLGHSTPEGGFDCSGFTRYVFGHFGYQLGQVAASQTSLGSVVERENLQTGDLLLFYDDGKTKIGHCGIYISGGDFIHSANPQRGVVIDNLNTNSYYSQRFVTARRIAGG